MPTVGQRCARHGLCRLRPARRLHRTGNQSLGHRRGLDPGRIRRRRSGDEAAHAICRTNSVSSLPTGCSIWLNLTRCFAPGLVTTRIGLREGRKARSRRRRDPAHARTGGTFRCRCAGPCDRRCVVRRDRRTRHRPSFSEYATNRFAGSAVSKFCGGSGKILAEKKCRVAQRGCDPDCGSAEDRAASRSDAGEDCGRARDSILRGSGSRRQRMKGWARSVAAKEWRRWRCDVEE